MEVDFDLSNTLFITTANTLETIQETYIAFAVSARPTPVNDRLARLLMLDRQGSPDVPDAWNAYEEELLHLILTIRSQYAGTETH